jgi:hypothetical protein
MLLKPTSHLMLQKLTSRRSGEQGKLRIGSDWNSITIIALSQANPPRAIAELVEDSIDPAQRRHDLLRSQAMQPLPEGPR